MFDSLNPTELIVPTSPGLCPPEGFFPFEAESEDSSNVFLYTIQSVTPLKITLNFSRVRGAKDPSLANLPSQLL